MAGDNIDEAKALELARAWPGIKGMDLAKVVSTKTRYSFNEGAWQLGAGFNTTTERKYKVVAYDFGVKRNILRLLAERGCDVTVVPAQTPAGEVLACLLYTSRAGRRADEFALRQFGSGRGAVFAR